MASRASAALRVTTAAPAERQRVRRGVQPPAFVLPPRPVYDACAPVVHAVVAAIALIALSPVFGVIALAVWLVDRGPVFYVGQRIGRGGEVFTIRKFRTMQVGIESRIGARLITDADKAQYCTPIGRLLKKSKLDELPQLLNVIRGQMRLVGPRPIRPVFMARHMADLPGWADRMLVPPGITGIAQIRGGYYTAPRNKLRYDRIYLRRRSFRLDALVLLFTLVKGLDRWLAMGLVLSFLFLFVSFVPPALLPWVAVPGTGQRVSLVSLLIAAIAAWAVLEHRKHAFSLYRCPLNPAIIAFAALACVAAIVGPAPTRALAGGAYYLVTGLLLAFLIVNGVGVRELTTVLLRTIALSSVGVSLGGLAQMFLANHGVGAFERGSRLESFLGNPVVLAVYLVLGLPLLLAEVMAAGDRRGARDFWIVCATISFVGIFLTQTRVSLVALLVTAGVFFCRRLRYAALFLTAFTLALGVLVASGLPRFTPAGVTSEVGQWVREYGDDFRGLPVTTWLIGDARLIPDLLVTSVPEPAADDTDEIPNMHLTLLRGHGILGWLVLVGTVLAALRVMKRAHDRTRVTSTRHTLWAIISAILGFLVSMHGTNAFHHLAIQVFFWSLVGIGLALAIDEGSPRRRNLIWRFAEAGD